MLLQNVLWSLPEIPINSNRAYCFTNLLVFGTILFIKLIWASKMTERERRASFNCGDIVLGKQNELHKKLRLMRG